MKPLIINDPIYGFIAIKSPLIARLINHPFFQRLRRISQMGLSVFVFPGAHHNRLEHALGCLHLAQKAIMALREKGEKISEAESEALQIALLFHDIGHGPFSHAIEKALLPGIAHEQISEVLIEKINTEMDGALASALAIFNNSYERPFFHQLLVGQVDLDRLDYLKRDSFYTGAMEGNINSSRLISMMRVVDNQLVFDEKANYSLEKFLLARRLMYWQVYLHKTSLVSELILVKILHHARKVLAQGKPLKGSDALLALLSKGDAPLAIDTVDWSTFLALDDSDVWYSLKQWQEASDFILSDLSQRIIKRNLFRVEVQDHPFEESAVVRLQEQWAKHYNSEEIAQAYVFTGHVSNQTYSSNKHPVLLQNASNETLPIHQHPSFSALMKYTNSQTLYYLCSPKS